MSARRVFCVIAVLACLVLGTVVSYADTLVDVSSLRLACYPAGCTGQTFYDDTSCWGGIVWLYDEIDPADVTFQTQVNRHSDTDYSVIYNVTMPKGLGNSNDNGDDLFGIAIDYPIGLDVKYTIDRYYITNVDWSRPSSCRRNVAPRGMSIVTPTSVGVESQTSDSLPLCICPFVYDNNSQMTVTSYTVIIRIKAINYDEGWSPDIQDVNDALAFPWDLPGVSDVIQNIATLTDNQFAAPLVYGAVFVMLAAMVIKMMM